MKQVFAGKVITEKTQFHLDRCLTCKSCETTCPSGVKFGRLADIGKNVIEQQVRRSWTQRLLRQALMWSLPYPQRFKPLLQSGRLVQPLLPAKLKNKLPAQRPCPVWPSARHPRRVLLLEGCVQRGLAPHIDALTASVLDQLGISAIRQPNAGCCGALNYHLSDHNGGLDFMRRMLDACWPQIEAGVEAIIMTASGCGIMLKDYVHLLHDDPVYAQKAAHFSVLTRDLSEVLRIEDLSALKIQPRKLAFQSPCTLQHGQQLNGVVEEILRRLGFELTIVTDAHLCCGSAGTYSILQPQLSKQLRANKLQQLQNGQPDLIATANIGCLLHLQEKSDVPVVHWVELLAAG
ncbi:glycolate oxidase iron-sulfur subunit [Crenothrix polyspora]|uniref:Glycolate oxidase iron-sulfur subunit n=1 Tax=Crenothrix polyspora TaxID=360316 RepID=A0A1R4HCD3_9GAMM|nr:glycolate oxidase iron-sulfur subunit [Crenothrix polyspora]